MKRAESQIQWKKFDCKIVDTEGQVIFEMNGVEAPVFWSQTAVDIVASKYFYKGKEKSVRQLVGRIARGFEAAFRKNKTFKTTKELSHHLEEIKLGLYQQKFAFNSPVWFNCGLFESYKVQSNDGQHYAYNFKTKKTELVKNAYASPQCSACFIQSVDDSMESIFNLLKSEAMLFKYGSGSGTNFTPLRSKYEKLKPGGKSSGLISFLEIFDKSAGSIKSGGVTRRAAKMVCLDVDHPEIIDFIEWKKNEEQKARHLIQAGYDGSLDGEVYRTISGQNSNNSVRVTDNFMQAVQKNEKWTLKYPSSGKAFKSVMAQDIWSRLCQSTWACADPGIQFHDTINEYNMCKKSDEIRASNPCSEYMFLDNTACNLASINLVRFLDQSSFDLTEFLKTSDLVFRTQEALVDYSSYPTQLIAANSHRFRPIGLGYANLGSLLMLMGIPYDSEQGRAWASAITAAMTGQAYASSIDLARTRAPFKEYKKNKKSISQVMSKQKKSLAKIDWSVLPAGFKDEIVSLWDKNIVNVKKYGLRNAQVTVIAPTGTIGLVMDCGTTGIEPDYALIKFKKLSGGGSLNITNPAVEKALLSLNYSPIEVERIKQHVMKTGSLKDAPNFKPEHLRIFQMAQSEDQNQMISAEGHLLMMAAAQAFLSGAISKTVNLPASSSVDDISEVYRQAWKLKLKAVSIYRDQSKFVQPLNNQIQSSQVNCVICKNLMVLEASCYRCHNCGYVSACVG